MKALLAELKGSVKVTGDKKILVEDEKALRGGRAWRAVALEKAGRLAYWFMSWYG